MIAQGEVWWADLGEPAGSEPGFRRPVVAVQGDAFNRRLARLKGPGLRASSAAHARRC